MPSTKRFAAPLATHGARRRVLDHVSPHQLTEHARRFHAGTTEEARRPSAFQRACEWISAAQGSPANIAFWLLLVTVWVGIFWAHLVSAAGTFLPAWFTGQGFNFPLNLVTTVAELFIGFLVATAGNRAQSALSLLIDGVKTGIDTTEAVSQQTHDLVQQNIALTREVRDLARAVHEHVSQSRPTPEDIASAVFALLAPLPSPGLVPNSGATATPADVGGAKRKVPPDG
jgi:hypothetical protein